MSKKALTEREKDVNAERQMKHYLDVANSTHSAHLRYNASRNAKRWASKCGLRIVLLNGSYEAKA